MCDGEDAGSDSADVHSGTSRARSSSGGSRMVSRRGAIRSLLAVGLASNTALSGCLYIAGADRVKEPLVFVSRKNRITAEDATHVVRTIDELRSALSERGATVWLPSDVKIRFEDTTTTPVPIASNVTLASDRGVDGGQGALIESTAYHPTIFQSRKSDIRVTGIRIKGPQMEYFDPRTKSKAESAFYARAFEFIGNGIEIDHCELFGWTSAAVSLGGQDDPTESRIHHNSIHHNQMQTLGYGLDIRNGTHLIEWNYFDRNRHSVAGFGHRQNGYEARFNVVGPHAVRHAFDMHGLSENLSGYSGPLAGKYLRVHHNVFELTDAAAVVLRGISDRPSWVRENWCAAVPLLELKGRRSIIRQTHADAPEKFQVTDNHFGPKAVKRGRSWLLEHDTSVRYEY